MKPLSLLKGIIMNVKETAKTVAWVAFATLVTVNSVVAITDTVIRRINKK